MAQRLMIFVVAFAMAARIASAQSPMAAAVSDQPGASAAADVFPLFPWDFLKPPSAKEKNAEYLKGIADCGFTVAGFVSAENLEACRELRLKAFVLPSAASRLGDKTNPLTDEQIVAEVKKLAESTRGHPAVIGYYVRDEPGARSFPYLAKIVDALRRHAPGKLAYINLFPGYATLGATDTSQLQAESFEAYLEQYIAQVKPDFVSYDDYMVQYSNDLQDEKRAAVYFRDLLTVRRIAMKHGLPFWNIVSSNQIRPTTTVPSPANLLLQAWTTLAAGGRSVAWYKYARTGYQYAPLDQAGRRTVTWSYLRLVNEQIRVIGPIVSRLKSTRLTVPEKWGPKEESPARFVVAAESDQPLMIGEFEGEAGVDHAIVVNLSLERSAKIRIDTQGRPLESYSPVDGVAGAIGNEFWLTAGQGMLIRAARTGTK